MNYRNLKNKLFNERMEIEDAIRDEQEKKKICSDRIRRLRRQLHLNEEEIHSLISDVIDENEANEETVEALKVEIEDLKYGSFEERM